jgi:hypothetical protein
VSVAKRMAEAAGIDTGGTTADRVAAAEPEFHITDAGHYAFTWPTEDGIRIIIRDLDRRKMDLWGMMTVLWRMGDAKPVTLLRTRINFFSTSNKESHDRYLRKQLDREWRSRLEYVGAICDDHHTSGEPAIWLNDVPDPKPLEFHLPPILESGEHTILYGDGGAGKSMLALAIALSVAKGIDLIPGLTATARCRVMYLDWETNKSGHARRERALLRGAKLEQPGRQILYKRMHSPLADASEELVATVKEYGIGLVIIDSAGMACGGLISDEQAVAGMFLAARSFGCTVLTITHVPKDNQSRKPIGSSYWWNEARACWEIKHDQFEGSSAYTIVLNHTKHNNQPKQRSLSFEFEYEGTSVHIRKADAAANAELNKTLSLPRRIEFELVQDPWKTAKELAGALESSEKRVGEALLLGEKKSRFLRRGKRPFLWGALVKTESGLGNSESELSPESGGRPLRGGPTRDTGGEGTVKTDDPAEALPW